MINQLPRWVWTAAWALAFIAGIVNVVGLLGFEHQAITHLTGTTSLLGAATGTFQSAHALHLFFVIVSFVVGTASAPPSADSSFKIQLSNLDTATVSPSRLSPRFSPSPFRCSTIKATSATILHPALAVCKTPWPLLTAGRSFAPHTSPACSPI